MNERKRLIKLIKEIMATPEVTCPHYRDGQPCDGCEYDEGIMCDEHARAADYLLKNGVTFAKKSSKEKKASREHTESK